MLKTTIRKLLFLLTALAVISGLFCACAAGGTSTATTVTPETTPPPETTSAPVTTVHLITIPDVENTDSTTAKTVLANKGLIPRVSYEYNNDYAYDMVIRTEPTIGSKVEEDCAVTVYVCKGPEYYELKNGVAALYNIDGVDPFVWEQDDPEGKGTKAFGNLREEKGFLKIDILLNCKSKHDISFYGDFGTASVNDTFDKTVPIEVEYDSKEVDNKGGDTYFTLIIPLSDLGEQKPTNLYTEVDFLVNGERKTFHCEFNLTW